LSVGEQSKDAFGTPDEQPSVLLGNDVKALAQRAFIPPITRERRVERAAGEERAPLQQFESDARRSRAMTHSSIVPTKKWPATRRAPRLCAASIFDPGSVDNPAAAGRGERKMAGVNAGKPDESEERSIRSRYEAHGADAYYREHADDYSNPHEPEIAQCIDMAVSRWSLDLSRVLDLAAGSGEATLALRELGAKTIDACDPYLFELYERRTGRPCERFSFEDVAAGLLAGRAYSLIVCSFALHLVDLSRLPVVCMQLALIAPALLVLTPHKRPEIREPWGWSLADEFAWARVRSRHYRSQAAHPTG
jgi:hypothetical protein